MFIPHYPKIKKLSFSGPISLPHTNFIHLIMNRGNRKIVIKEWLQPSTIRMNKYLVFYTRGMEGKNNISQQIKSMA